MKMFGSKSEGFYFEIVLELFGLNSAHHGDVCMSCKRNSRSLTVSNRDPPNVSTMRQI